MNTDDLPQDPEYENQVRNENINLDSDKNNSKEQNQQQQVYGEEYLGNSVISVESKATSVQSAQSPPPSKPAPVPANSLDIRAAGHPQFCVLHFIFKAAAIFTFFLISNTVVSFALTIVFASFDFWSVKNITGRILVLLKWDSSFDEQGTEKWEFLSTDPGVVPNKIDSTFFWFAQVTFSGFWIIITLFELITLSFFWTVLAFSCFILAGVNVLGFYKCRGEHQKKIKTYMAKVGIKALANSM